MRQSSDMGAWGPGIFSDDLAADIRGDYRELLEDQVPDDEATGRILAAYRHLDSDEVHVLWLALAAVQASLGRLDDEIKARALSVIDRGEGLEPWQEAGPQGLARREAALSKLRTQLTGPQPARRQVRRPWRHVTDLQPGDLLARVASNGDTCLLRVARIDDQRVGAAPVIELLDWKGQALPKDRQLRRLRPRYRDDGPHRPMTYRVARLRKKDPDWHDAGFERVAQGLQQQGDDALPPWSYCGWSQLGDEVDRLVGPPKAAQ